MRLCCVKYLPLLWAGMWRKPGRAVLMALQTVCAFALFGLLQGLASSVHEFIANAHRDRLYVNSSVSNQDPLPIAGRARIQQIPGVERVNERAMFMGAYRTPEQAVLIMGTHAEDFFSLYDEMRVSRGAIAAALGDLERLLDFVAGFIGGMMAAGAVCGALNSLYASVDARRLEIATLRAIGFSNTPIVLSLLIEGVLLALPGAALGALIAWILFDGDVVNTQGRVLTLTITPRVLLDCVGWALGIGLLGGSLPALRAARMPVASALRGS